MRSYRPEVEDIVRFLDKRGYTFFRFTVKGICNLSNVPYCADLCWYFRMHGARIAHELMSSKRRKKLIYQPLQYVQKIRRNKSYVCEYEWM